MHLIIDQCKKKEKGKKRRQRQKKLKKKHTTAGIRWWSPTQLLICRSEACVWQSGRDAQFSSVYGRMWQIMNYLHTYNTASKIDMRCGEAGHMTLPNSDPRQDGKELAAVESAIFFSR
jgi:hypothetical protein